MFELMRQINQTLIGTSWVRLPLAAKYLAIISLSIVIIKFMNGSKKIEEILLDGGQQGHLASQRPEFESASWGVARPLLNNFSLLECFWKDFVKAD